MVANYLRVLGAHPPSTPQIALSQGIVGCTPTNVPRHGKSLYKAYNIVGIYVFFYPQESLGVPQPINTMVVHVG